jgi:hypothetical protein
LSLGRPAEAAAELGELEKTIASQRHSIRRIRAFMAVAVALAAVWVIAHAVFAVTQQPITGA